MGMRHTASPKIGPPPVEVGNHHQHDMIRLLSWRGIQAVGKYRLATAYFLQQKLRSNDQKSSTFDSKLFVLRLSTWLPLQWHRKGYRLRDWLRPHSSRPSRRDKCSVLQDSSHWAGIGGSSLWQGQHSTPVGCCQPRPIIPAGRKGQVFNAVHGLSHPGRKPCQRLVAA